MVGVVFNRTSPERGLSASVVEGDAAVEAEGAMSQGGPAQLINGCTETILAADRKTEGKPTETEVTTFHRSLQIMCFDIGSTYDLLIFIRYSVKCLLFNKEQL